MIVLEYFERNDFPQLTEWIKDDELLMNWSGSMFSYPLTEKSLEWYIEDVNEINISDAFIYKAIDTTNGSTVGHISLGGISRKNRSGRISRVLVGGIDNRGRGCCKDMVTAVLKIGFEDLNLHRSVPGTLPGRYWHGAARGFFPTSVVYIIIASRKNRFLG